MPVAIRVAMPEETMKTGLIFKDQYNYIKERAKKSSYEGIENIIDAIGKARERLHSNVNFDLVSN